MGNGKWGSEDSALVCGDSCSGSAPARAQDYSFCDGRSRSAKGMVTSNHDGNSDAMREIRHVVLIAV